MWDMISLCMHTHTYIHIYIYIYTHMYFCNVIFVDPKVGYIYIVIYVMYIYSFISMYVKIRVYLELLGSRLREEVQGLPVRLRPFGSPLRGIRTRAAV